MKPIEVLQAIGLCNNTNDENILRETVRKILDTKKSILYMRFCREC